MNLTGKVLTAMLIGAVASGIHFAAPSLHPAVLLFAATIATALATSISYGAGKSNDVPARSFNEQEDEHSPAPAGPREEGQVKWFNVSKGFGFITKDNGEEIFVHFRSIRGEGRRSLRDGQRVSFIETESEKGPQAEDVQGL